MTLAAVRQCFSQISAAVPFSATILVGPKALIRIVERCPDSHQPTLVEWKPQAVRWRRRMHRRQTEKVCPDRAHVIISDEGVGTIRKCWIEPLAILGKSRVHGTQEVSIGPGSDAGFWVGSD